MSGHFTDRDERAWQRQAEQRIAVPLDIGFWIQSLWRGARRHRRAESVTALAATTPATGAATVTATGPRVIAGPRPCGPA
ncbi:hypothetical protein ACH414_17150 [Streptomyces sp. NPDC020422]|uniref:hypothetical protein n=1 Tax=Streptomyces sp. NPDC020422 TaxID=3365074 RepID=UPI00379BEEC5